MFTKKVLSSSDLPLLMNAANGVFDNPVDDKYASEFLADPRHHIMVTASEDIVIGFASAVHYIHPDKPTELWINEVGFAPAQQGIGKAIMNELLRLGKQLGGVNAWVLTDAATRRQTNSTNPQSDRLQMAIL
jgi:aminoglycoside 6'-N-acetyltransferase I